MRRRKPQPQSGPQKALKAIGGLLPTAVAGRTRKTTSRAGKKPIGLALVAGAAGLAFSQREKLQAKLGGGRDDPAVVPVAPVALPTQPPPAAGI